MDAMLSVSLLADRRMKITASDEFREIIREELAEDETNENSLNENRLEIEVLQSIREYKGYDDIEPYEVGALTSAPMLCDDRENPTEVWAFMDYAVTSIPALLVDKGYALLEHSEVEPK